MYFRAPPPPPARIDLLDKTLLKKTLNAAGGKREDIAARLEPNGKRPLNLRVGNAKGS
jgi:hypothetical protein